MSRAWEEEKESSMKQHYVMYVVRGVVIVGQN